MLVFFMFCKAGFVFAQNSAMFGVGAIMPTPAEAGKEAVFQVIVTNTGIESWKSGEFFVFVKIYDSNKEYLAESEKLRQMLDIDPGEYFNENSI